MNSRRRINGVVTSNKMTKTVVVEIGRTFRHPLYRKVVHLSKRVKAHDELGCQIGDRVQIVESRPLSREKRWVVESIVRRETKTEDVGGLAVLENDAVIEVASETAETSETEGGSPEAQQ
jgi:small subunit ribosomal protein S17